MPDKLTDNEIFATEIKCINRRANGQCNGGTDCCNCDLLMNEKDIISAYERAITNIDLINRLKAENDRLKGIKTTDWLVKGISKEQLEKEKIEAIRENAYKLGKTEAYKEFVDSNFGGCKGCINIGFRYPYASMYPCNNCIRADMKDYYGVKVD